MKDNCEVDFIQENKLVKNQDCYGDYCGIMDINPALNSLPQHHKDFIWIFKDRYKDKLGKIMSHNNSYQLSMAISQGNHAIKDRNPLNKSINDSKQGKTHQKNLQDTQAYFVELFEQMELPKVNDSHQYIIIKKIIDLDKRIRQFNFNTKDNNFFEATGKEQV